MSVTLSVGLSAGCNGSPDPSAVRWQVASDHSAPEQTGQRVAADELAAPPLQGYFVYTFSAPNRSLRRAISWDGTWLGMYLDGAIVRRERCEVTTPAGPDLTLSCVAADAGPARPAAQSGAGLPEQSEANGRSDEPANTDEPAGAEARLVPLRVLPDGSVVHRAAPEFVFVRSLAPTPPSPAAVDTELGVERSP